MHKIGARAGLPSHAAGPVSLLRVTLLLLEIDKRDAHLGKNSSLLTIHKTPVPVLL